jgi:simple sugar transport system permease protein
MTFGFGQTMGAAAPFVAMLIAGLGTIFLSFILSFFTVNLLGDHVVVGTAINMLMPAIALLIIFSMTGASTITLPPAGDLSMG